MLTGCDLSNHQGLGFVNLPEYQNSEFAIIQAVDPPPSFPPGVTGPQAEQVREDGKYLGYYLWLWNTGDYVADLNHKLSLITLTPDMRLWLDVEDATIPYTFSQERCLDALNILDMWSFARGLPPAGVYTGQWYINDPRYMNGWFPEGRKLWYADYGGARTPELTEDWPVHQYYDLPIDLNRMLESEIVMLEEPVDCQKYKDAIERAINRNQIEMDRKTGSGAKAALRRTIYTEIFNELFNVLQEG